MIVEYKEVFEKLHHTSAGLFDVKSFRGVTRVVCSFLFKCFFHLKCHFSLHDGVLGLHFHTLTNEIEYFGLRLLVLLVLCSLAVGVSDSIQVVMNTLNGSILESSRFGRPTTASLDVSFQLRFLGDFDSFRNLIVGHICFFIHHESILNPLLFQLSIDLCS